MIKVNRQIGISSLISNFMENSKINNNITKYSIYKPIIVLSISCALLSPSFCSASEISASSNIKNEITLQAPKQSELLEKMLKMSRDKKNLKMLSFNTQNLSGYGKADVKIIDSRFPSHEIYVDIINNYYESLDKKTDSEISTIYKPWLKMNISMYEFILSGKDGFSTDSVSAMSQRINMLKDRLADFDSKKGVFSKSDLEGIRDFVKNDLSRSTPSLDYIESVKNSIAVASSFYGSCSILYNNDILPKFERILLKNVDNKVVYGSSKDLIKTFFLNHEIAHCESQQSDFIVNNHNKAKNDYNKIKENSLFKSLDKNQVTKISQLAATYSEYSFEAYADIVGISKTIRDNNLKGSSASMFVNDIVNIRDRLSFLGDAAHSTGDVLKKVKKYYEEAGMEFGEDLLVGNVDKNIENLMGKVSPSDFSDSLKRFTIISSYSKKININFKEMSISSNEDSRDIDYKTISKIAGVSHSDINKHLSSLSDSLYVFSTDGNRDKISPILKTFNKHVLSSLKEKDSAFSLGI